MTVILLILHGVTSLLVLRSTNRSTGYVTAVSPALPLRESSHYLHQRRYTKRPQSKLLILILILILIVDSF